MRAGVRPTELDGPRTSEVRDGPARPQRPFVGRRYELVSLVNEGLNSVVWRAVDSAGARVALKAAKSAASAELMRREFRVLSTFDHPGICRGLRLLDDEHGTVLVMEYLDGGDLVSLAGSPARHWLPAVDELVDALVYLHGRGIAHRDVKARNVMFDRNNRVRLIDFGSAAEFGSARRLGGTTAEHRHPGGASGVCSSADDTYALAALIYELFAGRLPDPGLGPPGPPLGAERPESPALSALASLVLETLRAASDSRLESLDAFSIGIKSALGDPRNRHD